MGKSSKKRKETLDYEAVFASKPETSGMDVDVKPASNASAHKLTEGMKIDSSNKLKANKTLLKKMKRGQKTTAQLKRKQKQLEQAESRNDKLASRMNKMNQTLQTKVVSKHLY